MQNGDVLQFRDFYLIFKELYLALKIALETQTSTLNA